MKDMNFDPSLCQVLHISLVFTPSHPLETTYYLHEIEIDSVSSAIYLGATIADNLIWTTHTDYISKCANQALAFLKRDIRVNKKDLKSVAYKTQVRLPLKKALTVWSPHTH